MNIKKLFLVFTTALLAQFSFALSVPTPVVLASPQVQQSNRVVDFHNMLDAGTYGIYSDQTLVNGPPATGIKTAIVVYAYKDNYDKVVNQTVFDSAGSGWQEYYDYGTKKWSAWSQFGGGGGQKGDKGDKGDTGAAGKDGAQGIQGIQGVAGKDGANGKDAINPMTAINDMVIGGASGIPTRLAAGADKTVLTSIAGVPTWSTATGMTNPMTGGGQIIYGGTSGTPIALSPGTADKFLRTNPSNSGVTWDYAVTYGTNPVRSISAGNNITMNLSGTELAISSTGMVNPMSSIGEMIYAGANGFPTRLGAGTAGQVLTLSNAAPVIPIWQTPANILSFNVPISSVYADAAIPSVIVLKNSSGTTQLSQNGLLCNSTGLMNITQQFSLVVASGQTISISGRLTFYNLNAITQSNYYVNIQVIGLTTGGQLVNLGTQTQTTLSKAQYGYTNANFSAKQTLVTDLIAVGIQAQVIYAEANNTAAVNTMFAQVTIN